MHETGMTEKHKNKGNLAFASKLTRNDNHAKTNTMMRKHKNK